MTRTDLGIDATQALLDMLAGWHEFVADRIEETDNECRSYTEGYSDATFDLYRKVVELVWTDEPNLTPREFIEQHVLPLFSKTR